MSHFIGLVITNDYESVLAPYNEQDENYFDGHNTIEEYRRYYNNYLERTTDEIKQTFLEFVSEDFEPVKDNEEHEYLLNVTKERHFVPVRDADGNIVDVESVWEFWNDNAKWDWYSPQGGRWDADYGIILKENAKKNHSTIMDEDEETGIFYVKDIDFDAMFAKATEDAHKAYQTIFNLLGHIPDVKDIDEIKETIKDHDESWKFYHSQPDIEKYNKWRETDEGRWYGPLTDFKCTEDEYVAGASLPYFCIVTDKGWFEKGEMGWWACVSNEKKPEEWLAIQKEALKDIDPDTEVNLIDFHI